MMTELQTIFLTCLLGPEDPKAFFRFRKQAKEKERYWKDPENSRKKSREKQRKRKAKNPEKFAALERARYLADIAGAKARQQKQYWKDPEAKREEANARRRENPEEARRKEREYVNSRYKTDKEYQIEKLLRSHLNRALRGLKGKKLASALDLLGCSTEELRTHLESLFRPGMTWENRGPIWHVDHKRPCASFDLTDSEQQRICFHWTNLQPLFAAENLSKGAKYVQPMS